MALKRHDFAYRIPPWMLYLYSALAVILVPWIVWLANTLPARHLSHNWDITWVGFDLIMLVLLIATAYFGLNRSTWVAIPATALATLLVIDAWFDILTARGFGQFYSAWAMAIVGELPLAVLSFSIAIHAHARAISNGSSRKS
jgi:hypothetical protein